MMQTLQADRTPAVAGSFYSSSETELQKSVQSALEGTKNFQNEDIQALVVPHAGYIYSAHVAATSYRTLHKTYKNIFIIGSSHHINFNGVSLYTKGDYITPLGKVKVNQQIVHALLLDNNFMQYKKEAHLKEHTIEVQLPFLQEIYGNDFKIVPIILATQELETIIKTADALQPYFNDENLFIISSDLSHYPNYNDAKKVDMRLLNALVTNSTENFVNAIIENEKSKTANLHTSACGWSSLLTLLYLTQNKDYNYELLEYQNSGDSKYADKEKVVGYGALRVFKTQNFTLSKRNKSQIKELVKLTLYDAVLENKKIDIDSQKLDKQLLQNMGSFVTLHLNGKLKGCIGRFEPKEPLYKTIIDMTISASRYDNRFSPVTKEELKDIKIEVSVLTPRQRVYSIKEIEVGKHGIYIEYGNKNGTYLPQVAKDMGWNAQEFVKSCCEDKAGISLQNCKDAKLYTYEAIVF